MVAGQLTFVDASALVAVLDRAAPDHRLVGSSWLLELDAGSTLVTTGFNALSASRMLQERYGAAGPRALLEVVLPALRVEWCGATDFSLAVAAFLTSRCDYDGDQGGQSDVRSDDLAVLLDEQVKRRLRIRHTLRP